VEGRLAYLALPIYARLLRLALQLRNVKRLGKQFSFGRQEDSHELYVRLLEAVEAVQVRPCRRCCPPAALLSGKGLTTERERYRCACCSLHGWLLLLPFTLMARPPVRALQLLEAGGRRRYDLRTRETTLMHHVFAGYTRTAVECAACGHVSRTYECCTSLTLEVSPCAASLEAALRSFAAVERLDGANRWVG
jgi:hypothetical protein